MAKVVELVDGKFASRVLNSGVNASTVIAALSTAAGPVSVNSQSITNIQSGTSDTDAATVGQLPKTVLEFWPSYSGTPTQVNIFKTWLELMTARIKVEGPVTIKVVGTTVDDPGIIDPPPIGGIWPLHWPMTGVSIEAPINVPGFAVIDSLQGVAGGHLRFSDLACFDDLEFAKGICFQSRSTSYIFDNAVSEHYDTICSLNAASCTFQLDNASTGTSPLFPPDKVFVGALTDGCAFSKTNYNSISDCVLRFCAPITIPGTSVHASAIIVSNGIFIPGLHTLNGWSSDTVPHNPAIVYVVTDAVSGFVKLAQLNFYEIGVVLPNPQLLGFFNFLLCEQFMTVLQSYSTLSLQGTPIDSSPPTIDRQVLTAISGSHPGDPNFTWTAAAPNRDALSINGTHVTGSIPILDQVLKGVDIGGGTINWAPGDAPAGGVVSVSGTAPIEVTGGTGTTPVIGISSTPTFGALTVAASVGQFVLACSPLRVDGCDYDYDGGVDHGCLAFQSSAQDYGSLVPFAQGSSIVLSNATGLNDWSVACVQFIGAGINATLYFPSSYFLTISDLLVWFANTSPFSSMPAPTVQLFHTAFTAEGLTSSYAWAGSGLTVVTGFVDPPTFSYAAPVYAHFSSGGAAINTSVALGGAPTDTITLYGALEFRVVTDVTMTSTQGQLSEIVQNSVDGKLYQCVLSAHPMYTWIQVTDFDASFAGVSITAGYAIGIAPEGGTSSAYPVDISQSDISDGATPFFYGLAMNACGSTATVYLAKTGTYYVSDSVFDSALSFESHVGRTFYASATPGMLSMSQPAGSNQWVVPVGILEDYQGPGLAKIKLAPGEPYWLASGAQVVGITASSPTVIDFVLGLQVAQTIDPIYTTVGMNQVNVTAGETYVFSAVICANDATSVIEIEWYGLAMVLAGPLQVTGQTPTTVTSSPITVPTTTNMLIEARLTVKTAASGASRALCYSSLVTKV